MEPKPEKFTRKVSKYPTLVHGELWEDTPSSPLNGLRHFYDFLEIVKLEGINVIDSENKVLELGSGKGDFLEAAKDNKVNIVGVDVRPRGIDNSSAVIARIEQLPFADQSFAVAYSSSIFDDAVYNQNKILMMQEIARVLKSGGIYVAKEFDLMPTVEGLILLSSSSGYEIYKKL